MRIPALAWALLCFFAAPDSTPAPDQPPTFHSIKLGVPFDSQFQRCPTKDGDFPKYLSSPYKDLNGNTIPCFYEMFPPKTEPYPDVKPVRLVETIAFFWDEKRNPVSPMPGRPDVWLDVFVPASKEIGEGTVEAVRLTYDSSESNRVKTALSEKYGTSHPPAEKINPKIIEMVGAKLISQEVWKTGWGELMLLVADKYVNVSAKTQKLISFEQANKKDEF